MRNAMYCTIGYHANHIVESASAAYWDDVNVKFHDGSIRASFERLADLLGYSIITIMPVVELPDLPADANGEWIDVTLANQEDYSK